MTHRRKLEKKSVRHRLWLAGAAAILALLAVGLIGWSNPGYILAGEIQCVFPIPGSENGIVTSRAVWLNDHHGGFYYLHPTTDQHVFIRNIPCSVRVVPTPE